MPPCGAICAELNAAEHNNAAAPERIKRVFIMLLLSRSTHRVSKACASTDCREAWTEGAIQGSRSSARSCNCVV